MPEPLVSVVVPAFRRPQRLERLLRSLLAQELSAEHFEVIVVDDGGEAEVQAVVARIAREGALAVRYRRHDSPRGPAAARNTGWQEAQAPLVAFTDDDCVASAAWLRAGLEAAGEEPRLIVQGVTRPDPGELAALGPFSRTVEVESLGPQYETCNIFYPRAALESLGGFDERFGARPAAEDTDLAWRALADGWQAVLAPDALVFHAVSRVGARGMLQVASRWDAAMRLFAEHPGARVMLYRGVFWNVWHYLMWRSLLVVAGPGWLRRMVLTLHLLELRARARRDGAGLSAIGFLVVHDLVECWAVARGALRHRTLVL